MQLIVARRYQLGTPKIELYSRFGVNLLRILMELVVHSIYQVAVELIRTA
jgi:hypothetical protein